nr:hypothetical protein [Bacillus wiedmannii]
MVLSVGLLCGCNGVDEDEPDPTEEPSGVPPAFWKKTTLSKK